MTTLAERIAARNAKLELLDELEKHFNEMPSEYEFVFTATVVMDWCTQQRDRIAAETEEDAKQ